MARFDVDTLLFDLDGTLVDSLPDLAAAVDTMLAGVGHPPAGAAKVGIWVGNGMDNLILRALRDADHAEPDPDTLVRARRLFQAEYGAHFCVHSRLYPTVAEALPRLAAAGLAMGVVTNKPLSFTEPLLRELGIRDWFGVVLGGDSLPVRKPDPEPLHHAARVLRPAGSRVLMVGDSVNDIQAARRAGYPVVCLSYGYNHGHDIREGNPDAVIDTLAELPALLGPPSPQTGGKP